MSMRSRCGVLRCGVMGCVCEGGRVAGEVHEVQGARRGGVLRGSLQTTAPL